MEETSKNELLLRHRNGSSDDIKTGRPPRSGKSMAVTYLLAIRCSVYRQRDFHLGFDTELENLLDGAKGKGASGGPVRPKVPMRRSGTDCFVVAMKRGNSRGAKGAGHSVMIILFNWPQEEPNGYGGGQLLFTKYWPPMPDLDSLTEQVPQSSKFYTFSSV